MKVSRSSPTRRNSFAVANKSQANPGRKRRAHSIAPGDRLSPASKARRSLVPRKSILKAAVNVPDDEDDATQSMDITRDYRGFNNYTTRKSLGRRVSFANHAHVRLFEVPDHNTNSTASPQSSPAAAEDERPRAANDENVYPGAAISRRRSSARRSVAFSEGGGEESMDMDSDDVGFSPAAFFRTADEFAVDDEFDDENGLSDGDDMDVTEAISRNIIRKRSLSLGVSRQPLANLSVLQPSTEAHNNQQELPNEHSYTEEGSEQSQSFTSEGDVSQPMEFTVPLIRPPEPPSQAWLALRTATHSGNTPYIPSLDDDEDGGVQEMELTDAVSRLQAARASLDLGEVSGEEEGQHDSFTSTEDSFVGEDVGNGEDGNHTVNVTQLLRRVSLGPSADSTMDVTSVYNSQEQSKEDVINQAVPDLPSLAPPTETQGIYPATPKSPTSIPSQPSTSDRQGLYPAIPNDDEQDASTATPADHSIRAPSNRPPIFSAPQPVVPPAKSPPSAQPPPSVTVPKPFNSSFTPRYHPPASPTRSRPPSPSKAPPSPKKFSAAFAPPVVRPSPKKRSNDTADTRPSPAKRLAGPGKLSTAPIIGSSAPAQPARATAKLSPRKAAPFQVEPQAQELAVGPNKRTSIGFRRPSGYFAQRKSLAGRNPESMLLGDEVSQTARTSPAKKAAVALGRNSVGFVGDSDTEAWTRFDAAAEREGAHRSIPSRELALTEESDDPGRELEATQEHPPHLGQPDASPLEVQAEGMPGRAYPRPQSPIPDELPTPDNMEQDQAGDYDIQHNDNDNDNDNSQINPTEQWRGQIEEGDPGDDDGPQISVEQFFEMTGIRFMDEIAAPRRSTIHPSALRPSRRASTEGEIPLAEYVIAMAVDVPQLELYTHVSRDLQAWIERIKEIYKEAEEEALKMTPQLFQEFVTADENGQAELLHQLKLIKVHNHAQAKSEWYDWKTQWVEQLYQKADEGFENMEADARLLEGIIRQTQDMIPALQREYDQLMDELAKEKAEVAELEGCDQDYLNELKATIAEQGVELDTFRADVEEATAKLDRLHEKLEEVEMQKKEATVAIENAERGIHLQKNSTRAEVFQLKDELEALENLHMWKATKISPDLFEFTFASSYSVSIPCIKFRPVAADIQIRRTENAKTKYKEAFPVMSALMLRTARQLVTRAEDQGIRQIVQRLGDYWSSCSQLQAQLKLVAIKYPVSIEEKPSGFSATAIILFPSVKAKALISFIFDTPNFSSWPMLIHSTRCEIKVAYGPIDRDTIQNAVTARLQQATPINNHACLLDACMEASDCFA
ncbi:hypothetical protein PAXRUDRAFT_823971 [Paxillus rubicundulus Ve08.2h10]|uniref:Spc7 kinetochore protein domain-containing protein n=1 Tax=Paxillus rubicundulus Ve08.2h10 TaxID=930991 RepID=A0A0D0DUX6_9AGAM|nr:hypothetical protein PAXRUDRAFT_823971 [Paxillus rubicundulus Ve08.2h10]